MVNQSIALQARPPAAPSGGGNSFAQNMQIINMMAQRTAAERQAQQSQQTMGIQAAQEGRAAALAVPTQQLAEANATKGDLDTLMSFNQHVAVGLQAAKTPDQVIKYANIIGSQPQFQGINFQNTLQQAVSSMPKNDPAGFADWKTKQLRQTMNGEKQLQQHFVTRDLGTTSDVFASPEFGGGAGQVVPGSTATKTPQLTGMNVEGVGAGGYDPATNTFSPAAMGPVGGAPAPTANLVGGARGGAGASGAPALATNPGALKDGPFARAQPGYAGASGGFATFNTPAQGVNAQENLLTGSYINKGVNTIDKIVNRYAPPGAENSPASVANYKQYIAQQTGIDPASPISAAQVPAVAKAMREFETGQRAGGNAPAAAVATEAPMTTLEASKLPGRKGVSDIIGDMRKYYAELQTRGGAVVAGGPMGENVINYFNATSVGKPFSAAAGTLTQETRDKITNTRRLLLQQIKKASGMSAQEMNSNVELQGLLDAATDPSQSMGAVKATLDTIERQYGMPKKATADTSAATGGKQRRPLTDFGKAR